MRLLKLKLKNCIISFFCFGILFCMNSSKAQLPTPVIFKPLAPPINNVYHFKSVGLVVLSNQHELQFWDETTKAYYGNYAVLPKSAFNCTIRIVEHIEAYNTIAIVWEEYTNIGKDTIYKDFLTVINLTTLQLAQAIEPNGMLALIQYKFNKKIILPKLQEAENIYQYSYNAIANCFYTCSRTGEILVYKKGEFNKKITSTIELPQLFVADTSNTYLIIASKKTAQVKRIHIQTEKVSTISNLKPIKTCMAINFNYKDEVFSTQFFEEGNSLFLIDSANRLQYYSVTKHTIEDFNILPKSSIGNVISFQFNLKDSSLFSILEIPNNRCERSLVSLNLKTGLSNTYNGGSHLQITNSFYGSNANSLRFMVSGTSEQEVDLSTLTEKTNQFLFNSNDKNLQFTAQWENGYVSVFKEENNTYKLKVFEFNNNKSNPIYIQQVQLTNNENIVGIEAKNKWYITTKNNDANNIYNVDFSIYDSLHKCIFKLPTHAPLQLMNNSSFAQKIFSYDGKYFIIKEYLSSHQDMDSCRVSVFSTKDFSIKKELLFTEYNNGNIFKRFTVALSDSTEHLYVNQLKKVGNQYLNHLMQYDLKTNAINAQKEFQLLIDPSQPNLPFYVHKIKISKGEEMVLWTGSVNIKGNIPANSIYYQAIRGRMLNASNDQWGINMNLYPEVENVLLFNQFVAVQLEDHMQFYKWQNNMSEYFLTLIPVYNEKTVEASALFVSYEKNFQNFNYYEKTGNEDCISFKFGNHSYRRSLFDLTFNRPDLILEQIPEHDKEFKELLRKAVLKRSERITNKLQDFKPELLPTVTIKNTGYIGNKFKLALSIKSKLPIQQIKVTINGTVVKKSTSLNMEFGEIEYNLFEILALGENAIEVVVVNKNGLESLPLRIIQNHNKPQEKPGLHVLVVSVSEYANRSANLPFAVKDGRDMSQLFKHQLSDTLFAYIQVDTLFNKAANNYAVQQWLLQKKQTDPNDYVIVFYSGHGLLNSNKELQLATSFTQFEDAKNTIDFSKLLSALDEIPARQKLFLIDACHSGDLDKSGIEATAKNTNEQVQPDSTTTKSVSLKFKKKQDNPFEAMQKLFSFSEKGNGTIVFSASGGMQVAYEGATYQNGYFTYALKEALLYNKANENNYGALWLNQLIKYTTKRVTEISNGKQTPNLRISHPDINWRIK